MKKIMIADDEPGIVEMIKGYFEMSGYEVITAQDGTSALEKISQRPDLILLDINMPGMDGLEVCRLVREHVTCPVIFLTARLENGDKIERTIISSNPSTSMCWAPRWKRIFGGRNAGRRRRPSVFSES